MKLNDRWKGPQQESGTNGSLGADRPANCAKHASSPATIL